MNRVFNNIPDQSANLPINPLHRPGRQLRKETEAMLRDLAYVLQLTRRIKNEMLEEKEEAVMV